MDIHWQAWKSLDIKQWPTLLLLDMAGRESGRLVGGGAVLDPVLSQLCKAVRPQDRIGYKAREMPSGLSSPMGLVASSEKLYIADTGHHRVLECTQEGRVLRQFGSGLADWMDGVESEAAFNRPSALALDRSFLYVADTGNHLLRKINLLTGQVDTLIGNGRQGDVVEGVLSQPGGCSLSQPTAVAVVDNRLLFAQAGDNRIWSFELGSHAIQMCAGSGALDLRDGGSMLAAFAQPVALLVVQQSLYVCDALSSAIRCVQLRTGVVQTLLGQGLGQFGHADGVRSEALLQYPLALGMEHGSPWLWIADAGNGALRRLRLGGGELTTVDLPRAVPGMAGLAAVNGAVWIADTDGNALLRYDPASGDLADIPIGE